MMEIYECPECEDEVEFLEDGLCMPCWMESQIEIEDSLELDFEDESE